MISSPAINFLQSSQLSSAMESLSIERMSFLGLKRKPSDDNTSPMATAMVKWPEQSVISPRKKSKCSQKNINDTRSSLISWRCAVALDAKQPIDSAADADTACAVSAPVAWADEPETQLVKEILDILDFLLD